MAIVGFGRIGRRVAQLLKNFNVHLIAVDPALSGVVEGARIVTQEEAFKTADIISLHLSGDQPVLCANEFAMMKDGVVLLNGARGNLIDEAAFAAALESKKVHAAWLDVFSKEPYGGPLTNTRSFLLTSHIGSYTLECRKNMEMEAARNLVKGFEN